MPSAPSSWRFLVAKSEPTKARESVGRSFGETRLDTLLSLPSIAEYQ